MISVTEGMGLPIEAPCGLVPPGFVPSFVARVVATSSELHSMEKLVQQSTTRAVQLDVARTIQAIRSMHSERRTIRRLEYLPFADPHRNVGDIFSDFELIHPTQRQSRGILNAIAVQIEVPRHGPDTLRKTLGRGQLDTTTPGEENEGRYHESLTHGKSMACLVARPKGRRGRPMC